MLFVLQQLGMIRWVKDCSWSLDHVVDVNLLLDFLVSDVSLDFFSQSSNFLCNSNANSIVDNSLNVLSQLDWDVLEITVV